MASGRPRRGQAVYPFMVANQHTELVGPWNLILARFYLLPLFPFIFWGSFGTF
jgi:hypothetical protein